jgi:hypothetical protein
MTSALGNTLLESFTISPIPPTGGRCTFTLRDENGTELSVELGVLEARAISDSLLAVAAKMQLARQNGRSIEP